LAANGVLCGFGARGYLMALQAIAAMLADANND
jgi:3-dehydroquinate dehydratase